MTPASQRQGIALLLAAIFLFSLMDAMAKLAAGLGYPPMQVVFVRLAINLALVLALFAPRLRQVARTRHPGLQVLRGLTQVATVGLFFISLRHIGLAQATALTDINPVLIILLAAVFLGETITRRKLIAIVTALAGALIVLRPGLGVVQPAAILPLIAAVTYAIGAIATRLVRGDSTATSVLWGTTIATAVAGLAMPLVWVPIAPGDLWVFALMGLVGTVAQAALIRAYALGEASVLAPFGYVGLIWAGLWGWLIFDMLPDIWTVIGALVIAGAGLYLWRGEAQAARPLQRTDGPA